MPLMPRLASLWRSLFRKPVLDRALDEELGAYLDALVERKRAAGMDEPEARRAALMEMGGIEQVKEDVRAGRIGSGLEALIGDVRHAWRSMGRMPGLAGVAIASLAVGIGVNTAIFSWIQRVVLHPLPGVRDAALLHLVEARSETGAYPGASWLEYRDLRERVRTIPDLAAFRMTPLSLGETSRSQRVFGLLVSENYFSALGLRPALGRFFAPETAPVAADEPVAVLSHELWRTRWGGHAAAVGAAIRVNGRDLTVIGVAPPGFQGTVLGLNFGLWVRAELAPALLGGSRELEDRRQRGYTVMGRLASGASMAQVQAEVDAAAHDLARLHPETNANMGAEVMPFWRAPRGPQRFMARGLALLQAIMLLLLLAVCANTANLVLARASARRREIGVRLALGAGRWRVVRLVLAENLVLGLIGGGLGAALAAWGTTALRSVPMTAALPIRFQTGVDGAGLAFAVLLGLGSGLLFGLAPALQLARIDPQRALHAGARIGPRGRLQGVLMGAEAALALVVLVVAALFFRSLSETRDADPGFRRQGVLLAAYDLSGRTSDAAAAGRFAATLLERVRRLPAVEAAAIARSVPLDIHGLPPRPFTLEGRARADGAPDQALSNVVTPGYFRTMGIPFRRGTDFADLGDVAAPPQAIVNEEFVRRFLDGAEAVGRRLRAGGRAHAITGVVRNSTSDSFGEPPAPVVYFSYRDRPALAGEIHLRTREGAEMGLAPDVRRVVGELDPTVPVYDVRTLVEHVDKNLVFRRIPAQMFAVLGPLLLGLAAIGIYAVVSFTVARRTTEIGVRMALGATSRRVVAQIVGESLRVIGVGALAGWLVALVIHVHVARAGTSAAAVLLGVPAVLLLVAAVACWIPARRATTVPAMVALRHE
jgi:predicted permease